MRLQILAATVALTLWTAPALAHFIWVDVVPTEKGPTAEVYFSETPEADSAALISKVTKAKGWVRGLGGEPKPLDFAVKTEGDTGALVGKLVAGLEQTAPMSVEVDFEYGAFKRGETALLLHYYAKHLAGRKAADFAVIGRSEKLPLDIVPHVDGDKLRLTVLWQGKPAAGAEVILLNADGEEASKLSTNDQGQAEVAALPGKQAVRAKVVEADKKGEINGQAYNQAWHIATLTFELPGAEKPTTAATQAGGEGEITANELLERARNSRAVWDDFPGFKAKVVITVDNERSEGEIVVDDTGDVALSGISDSNKGWASQQLQLMIRHRLPAPFSESGVVYGDDGKNPLGRLVKFEGDSAHSAYRVKDDVIREVNRSMGKLRFTISTLEISRNAEGKYLTQNYSASYWDVASGKLTSNEAVAQKWVRVGKLDLPAAHVVVKSSDGEQKILEITFSDHELLPTTAVSSAR